MLRILAKLLSPETFLATPRGPKHEQRRRAYIKRTAQRRRALLEKRGEEAFWKSPKGRTIAAAIAEERFRINWRDRESELDQMAKPASST